MDCGTIGLPSYGLKACWTTNPNEVWVLEPFRRDVEREAMYKLQLQKSFTPVHLLPNKETQCTNFNTPIQAAFCIPTMLHSYQKCPKAGINELILEHSPDLFQHKFFDFADIFQDLLSILPFPYLTLDFDLM